MTNKTYLGISQLTIVNKVLNYQQSTINKQPSTNTMEVHHHPHAEKKNFKEYFLEFLMIFLAVSMGFIAENIRERFANTETEKRNMEIIVNNLKDDTSRIKMTIDINEAKLKTLDTLLSFQTTNNPDTLHSGVFYSLFMRSFPVFWFLSNNAAIEQMKSSGSLRLVKNKTVLNSILDYGYGNNIITINQNYCDMWVNKEVQNASRFMSFRNVFPGLKPITFPRNNVAGVINYSENKGDAVLEFFNDVAALRSVLSGFYIINLHDQQKDATALIKLLQKEYHLENE